MAEKYNIKHLTQPKKRKIAWTQTENYDISFDPEKETRESVENVVTQLGVLLLEPKLPKKQRFEAELVKADALNLEIFKEMAFPFEQMLNERKKEKEERILELEEREREKNERNDEKQKFKSYFDSEVKRRNTETNNLHEFFNKATEDLKNFYDTKSKEIENFFTKEKEERENFFSQEKEDLKNFYDTKNKEIEKFFTKEKEEREKERTTLDEIVGILRNMAKGVEKLPERPQRTTSTSTNTNNQQSQ